MTCLPYDVFSSLYLLPFCVLLPGIPVILTVGCPLASLYLFFISIYKVIDFILAFSCMAIYIKTTCLWFASVSLPFGISCPSFLPLLLSICTDEDASGSGGGQQYADDWKAGAAPVVPPARPPRPPRPPRRDGLGVRGGSGSARYNQGRSRNLGSSVGLHAPRVFILLPSALTLLGLR